jgi:flagellar biosynthesis/type III secretory pathway M-ring protein FliF/YscJ
MDALAVLLVLLALAAALAVILSPLRAGHREAAEAADEAAIADLQTAKEGKYLEIREAEMDYRTGKLSEADWRIVDRQLRAEAVELLRRLDSLGASEPRSASDVVAPEPLPSPEPCSKPSSPSSRSGSASS